MYEFVSNKFRMKTKKKKQDENRTENCDILSFSLAFFLLNNSLFDIHLSIVILKKRNFVHTILLLIIYRNATINQINMNEEKDDLNREKRRRKKQYTISCLHLIAEKTMFPAVLFESYSQ